MNILNEYIPHSRKNTYVRVNVIKAKANAFNQKNVIV